MKFLRAFFVLPLLWVNHAIAQDEPIVRVEVTPEAVNVGESAQLRVTVLVPTWFPRPPVFPSFELSNAITRLPPDSSYPTSERVGRETWSGIIRNYRVYPMLGATYRLAGQTIRVTWANPGADPLIAEVPIPDIEFRGVVPEGAEGLDPYLAGTGFTIRREVEGDLEALEPGDAIVVRYVAELEGLPAIFIPPLAPDLSAPGVSAYADEPVIDDETGSRTETVTLVFEAGGDVDLSGLNIDWWNMATAQIETAAVDPLTITVIGPAIGMVVPSEADAPAWRSIAVSSVVAVLIILTVWRLWPVMAERKAAARRDYEASEQFAYRRLQAALNGDDAAAAHQQMLGWVARIAPGYDLRRFASEYGDEALRSSLSAFIAGLYGGSEVSGGMRRLASGIAEARHACLRRMETTDVPALPPLNP